MAVHLVMADSDDSSIVRLISFNSRGFNESKKRYISGILSDCDILFLQEHWLSDDQLSCLSSLSLDHVAVGVSGFSNSDVLSGRPFGGCAILWRSALNLVALPVATCSSRLCAMQFSNNNIKLLCICVYMPYEKDVSSLEEFQFQLIL